MDNVFTIDDFRKEQKKKNENSKIRLFQKLIVEKNLL